jgi:hypothetical protein
VIESLPHPRAHDLDGHALDDEVLGVFRWCLAVGATQPRPTALERPDAQHAGAIDQCGHHIALARFDTVFADDHVSGEEGHWPQGGIGDADGEDAGAAAEGEGIEWRGFHAAGADRSWGVRYGHVNTVSLTRFVRKEKL